MKRIIGILSLAGLSSVYLLQPACVLREQGFSILPTISFSSVPFIGSLFT